MTTSTAHYGYRVISEPHKAWLEIDEDEAVLCGRYLTGM